MIERTYTVPEPVMPGPRLAGTMFLVGNGGNLYPGLTSNI